MAGYDPETLTLLRTALDEAWASLPAGRKPETLKSEMAQRILKQTADGVRDPARLRASIQNRAAHYENFAQARSVAHHIRPLPPEDDQAQPNRSKCADGDEPRTERHHGHDHGEIVRPGVAAVRAITASRIQHARRAHPAKGNDPADSSQRYLNEQTGKDCRKWNPPRKQTGAFAAEPVA
jgi:hypothetical protein